MSNRHYHFDSFEAGEEWGTPTWIWGPLSRALNGFDLDPTSGAEDARIARDVITADDDPHGLTATWYGDVWANPPYGRDPNPKWAKKVRGEVQARHPHTVTILIPNSTSADWWHETYARAEYLTFIDKRVKFIDNNPDSEDDENSASFGSVIASFEVTRTFPPEYVDRLRDIGHVRARGDNA